MLCYQKEGMEVTGTERERSVVFCMAVCCLHPRRAAWVLPAFPEYRSHVTRPNAMPLDEDTCVVSVYLRVAQITSQKPTQTRLFHQLTNSLSY